MMDYFAKIATYCNLQPPPTKCFLKKNGSKKLSYISRNRAFCDISGSNFPKSKNEKKPLYCFLYFKKLNFLARLRTFLCFSKELAKPGKQEFLMLLFTIFVC